MTGVRGTLKSRFWAKVAKGADDECWLWLANRNNKGYGMFRPGGVTPKRLAHRISYIIANGLIRDGLKVLHRCDNPSCVNPAHLFLGTMKDNVADMDRKGRRVVGINPNNKPPIKRGSQHGEAKLIEAEALAIRDLYEHGMSQRALARAFGIDRRTVQRIIRRLAWKHV